MEYKLIEKAAFNFAGVSARVPMQFEGVNQEIVKLAQSITQRQKDELHRLQNTEPFEIVNVSYNSDTDFMKEEGYLTHLIGVHGLYFRMKGLILQRFRILMQEPIQNGS